MVLCDFVALEVIRVPHYQKKGLLLWVLSGKAFRKIIELHFNRVRVGSHGDYPKDFTIFIIKTNRVRQEDFIE